MIEYGKFSVETVGIVGLKSANAGSCSITWLAGSIKWNLCKMVAVLDESEDYMMKNKN